MTVLHARPAGRPSGPGRGRRCSSGSPTSCRGTRGRGWPAPTPMPVGSQTPTFGSGPSRVRSQRARHHGADQRPRPGQLALGAGGHVHERRPAQVPPRRRVADELAVDRQDVVALRGCRSRRCTPAPRRGPRRRWSCAAAARRSTTATRRRNALGPLPEDAAALPAERPCPTGCPGTPARPAPAASPCCSTRSMPRPNGSIWPLRVSVPSGKTTTARPASRAAVTRSSASTAACGRPLVLSIVRIRLPAEGQEEPQHRVLVEPRPHDERQRPRATPPRAAASRCR